MNADSRELEKPFRRDNIVLTREHSLRLRDCPPMASDHCLLTPPINSSFPLIICFHGSNDSCAASWSTLTSTLSLSYSVLCYERGSSNPTPSESIDSLSAYLRSSDLRPPYILIAHSHGGAFARCFLHSCPRDVAGMVLVETGQEAAWDETLEQAQYARCVLGSRPLSVIRGNSFLRKWADLEAAEAELEEGSAGNPGLKMQREMLRQLDAEDERLKKAQLTLSRNHRYVHLPDCGHHIVRDRPDVVAQEVRWVMENLYEGPDDTDNRKRSFHLKVLDMLKVGKGRKG
ncbi:hypothetical protein VKT23_005926 [Stygiomarasmius scandens]|uniref:AB hydrolase-1 domain-containing protein n=1 Tax=Marasmiellus scandens TaxID=2682957 RepID=A0ABR1JQU4_9AGAR